MFFRKAVLVVHGFGGGTWENEDLVTYLQLTKKYDVYSFTLPKHEKPIISNVKYQDWLDAAENMLLKILKKYPKVIIIGHSMGTVITSYLTSKYPSKIKKIVLLSPAFDYFNLEQNKKDFLDNFKKGFESEDGIYPEIVTKVIKFPPSTLIEFAKLIKNCKETIKDVKCPLFIMHGSEDEIVPLKSTKYALDNALSKKKYFTLVENVKHRIIKNSKQELVCKHIYYFLNGGLQWKLNYKSKI